MAGLAVMALVATDAAAVRQPARTLVQVAPRPPSCHQVRPASLLDVVLLLCIGSARSRGLIPLPGRGQVGQRQAQLGLDSTSVVPLVETLMRRASVVPTSGS